MSGRKKQIRKSSKVLFNCIIISLLLLINIGTLKWQLGYNYYRESGSLYSPRQGWTYTDIFSGDSDVVTQYFRPPKSYLECIMFRLEFSLNEQVSPENIFLISMYDEKEQLVCEEELYVHEYSNWNAYTFNIEKEVNKNKLYKLVFKERKENEKPSLFFRFLLSEEGIEEEEGYEVNGEKSAGNIELAYRYSYKDWKPLLWIIIGDLVVCIGLLSCNVYAKNGKRNKILEGALWALTPIIMFGLMQEIIGGISNIQIKYIPFNLFILYGILIIFTLFFKKTKIALMLFSCIILIFALIEYFVMEFRGSPFMLMDVLSVKTAMNVSQAYSFDLSIRLGIELQFFLMLFYAQFFGIKQSNTKKIVKNRILSMGLLVLAILLIYNNPFGIFENKISFYAVDQEYLHKGYFYILFSEVQSMLQDKPENYSVESIRDIVNNVENGISVESTDDSPMNIIVIMNESFADFDVLGAVKTKEKIAPYIKGMDKNVIKGYLQVPVFGGSTANTEYETLTGNSTEFLPVSSIPYILYTKSPEYGLTLTLKHQGYRTIAMHPFDASGYNREKAYENMGFEEFYSIENWESDYKTIRSWMSDQSVYEKIFQIYQEKNQNEKLFVFCVTIQNHGGYSEECANGYEDKVSLDYEQNFPEAEQYLALINESDKAFKSLINYFENIEEKTMIVFFGDHMPMVESEFYETILGKQTEELSWEEQQLKYQIPYIIWTNYPQETFQENISSNYLGSIILQRAGLKLTTYNKFLLKLKQKLPIIGKEAVMDATGAWYEWNELPEQYENMINDYRILQYNNMFDQKKLIKNIFSLQ